MLYLQLHTRTSTLRVLHLRFSAYDHFNADPRGNIVSRLMARRARSAGKSAIDGTRDSTSAPYDDIAVADINCPMADVEGLLDFAEWAFGLKGLLALQFLAVGDFSHEGRYERQHVLFVRSDLGATSRTRFDDQQFSAEDHTFSVATTMNLESWPGLQEIDLEFLSACPSDSLMESPFG